MTGACGAVITPLRMLDVLSSGGVTNGQALAQGPYLKIRWAVGVSRGRWDRRRGVEEALWRLRLRRCDVDPLSFRPQGGYQKICSGGTSPGGFVMCHPNRFPGNRQWSADDPTAYCSSARRGGLFALARLRTWKGSTAPERRWSWSEQGC
ncbi:hypothetical protein THAOC_25320 [Thalassiosira oceanica]|uniref:Uncharacterized protein n=1 Tax=Thalassiosira oceanica TaxID=159749 RepID=K0RRJ8_THAOC|nr:hypothetical protein THAOC_25320 [Thalassiosira oceanica]|eukprot:EJK54999.1 hypothetical protein THAOC_25320 [Thalassiosira oceanica]